MNKFKVDFIGVGAEKSATTWIADCLKEHPEINFSSSKEVYFFNDFDPHYLSIENRKYKRGLRWYARQFTDTGGQVTGEFSPTYLYDKKAAGRIKKDFPEAKIIVSLRDPVDRAYSQYLHDRRIGLLRRMSFRSAIGKHDSYFIKGNYYPHLKYYLDIFGKDKVFIVLFDDIKKDPKKTLSKTYSFLNVDESFIPVALTRKSFVSGRAVIPLLNHVLIHTEYFLKKKNLFTVVRILEKLGVRKVAYWFVHSLNSRRWFGKPTIGIKDEKELRRRYVDSILKLEKLIKRDLSAWR